MNEFMWMLAGGLVVAGIVFLILIACRPSLSDSNLLDLIENHGLGLVQNEHGWGVLHDGLVIVHCMDLREALQRAERLL